MSSPLSGGSERLLCTADSTLETWLAALSAGATDTGELEQSDVAASQIAAQEPAGDTLLMNVGRSAMACEFEVLLNQYQYRQGVDLAVEALDLVERLEDLLSIYRPRSELSELNRWGGQRPVNLSLDTLRMLCLAGTVHQATQGAFDVTAGTLSEVWGFSRRQGRKPDQDKIDQALQCVGMRHLDVDVHASTAQLRAGVAVNPGGIGKGYALDRASQRLLSAGVQDFMVHGGLSSVAAYGNRQHHSTGGGWLVSLKHPWRWEQHLGSIRLRNQALATSGSGKQFFHFGGKRYSHIIDPRTGWPAQSMMSATVVCASSAVADAVATALFVMGPAAAQEFCRQHPAIGAILVFQPEQSSQVQIETYNLAEGTWRPEQPQSNH